MILFPMWLLVALTLLLLLLLGLLVLAHADRR